MHEGMAGSGSRQREAQGDDHMTNESRVEKFSASELTDLRTGLLQSGIDSIQARQVLASFLAGRGYGADSERLRDAVLHLEGGCASVDCIQRELERVALVM
jgi:hypothetical protein